MDSFWWDIFYTIYEFYPLNVSLNGYFGKVSIFHANSFVVVENHHSFKAGTGCKKYKANFVTKNDDDSEYSFIYSVNMYHVMFLLAMKIHECENYAFDRRQVLSYLNIRNCLLTLFPKPNTKQYKLYIIVHMLLLYHMNFLS